MAARDPSVTVAIDRIVLSRKRARGVCPATVEHYRWLLEEGHEPPPLVLRPCGEALHLVDGRHRLEALRAAGWAFAEAFVEST